MLETIVLLFIAIGVIGAAGSSTPGSCAASSGQFHIKVERKETGYPRPAGHAVAAGDLVSAPAYPPAGSAAPEPWRPS